MGFDAVFAGNIPTADQRPDAIGDQLFACQYGEDSRHRRGRRGIDAFDLGMSVR